MPLLSSSVTTTGGTSACASWRNGVGTGSLVLFNECPLPIHGIQPIKTRSQAHGLCWRPTRDCINNLLRSKSIVFWWGRGFEPFGHTPSRMNERQIDTRVPNSTTAFPGNRKNSTTPPAFWLMVAKSLSRQLAIPPPGVGTTVSRLRK